jgi:hypothetical protein
MSFISFTFHEAGIGFSLLEDGVRAGWFVFLGLAPKVEVIIADNRRACRNGGRASHGGFSKAESVPDVKERRPVGWNLRILAAKLPV